jgi:hypothetical protein
VAVFARRWAAHLLARTNRIRLATRSVGDLEIHCFNRRVARLAERTRQGLGVALLVDTAAAERVLPRLQARQNRSPVGIRQMHRPTLRLPGLLEAVRPAWNLSVGQSTPGVGAKSNSASTHGAVRKLRSVSGCGVACDSTHTCTLASPEMPTCAYPETGIAATALTFRGTEIDAANVFSGLSRSLFCSAYVSFAVGRFVRYRWLSHLIDLNPYASGTASRASRDAPNRRGPRVATSRGSTRPQSASLLAASAATAARATHRGILEWG